MAACQTAGPHPAASHSSATHHTKCREGCRQFRPTAWPAPLSTAQCWNIPPDIQDDSQPGKRTHSVGLKQQSFIFLLFFFLLFFSFFSFFLFFFFLFFFLLFFLLLFFLLFFFFLFFLLFFSLFFFFPSFLFFFLFFFLFVVVVVDWVVYHQVASSSFNCPTLERNFPIRAVSYQGGLSPKRGQFTLMVYHQGGLLPQWGLFMKVTCHLSGDCSPTCLSPLGECLPMWSIIPVGIVHSLSPGWSFTPMGIVHQCDLSPQWGLFIKMVYHQGGLSPQWGLFTNVV